MSSQKTEKTHPNAASFPPGLGGPALRALASAGIRSMNDVAQWTEADLVRLHGMGPKALGVLLAGRSSSPKPRTRRHVKVRAVRK